MIGMGKTFQLFMFYGVPPYDYFAVDDLFHHIKNNYLFTQILNFFTYHYFDRWAGWTNGLLIFLTSPLQTE